MPGNRLGVRAWTALVAPVACMLALCAAPDAASASPNIPPAINRYRMNDLSGKPHALSEYRGHPVVLNVWATWCPPCRRETPRLERAFERFRKRGVIVLGIDQDEPLAKVRAFAARFHLHYPVVLDPKEVYGAAAGFQFPTTVFVDRSGSVRYIHHGAIAPADLQRHIEALLR